jgi:recombination protein RecA
MAKSIETKKKTDTVEGRDALLSSLVDIVKKTVTDQGKVAFFLGEEDDPTTVVDWLSTGDHVLDLAISNRPHGGIPVGRITEISGLEASGKSLMIGHILAETQKKGGLAVLIDTESAIDQNFLSAIGVNVSDLLVLPLETIEDIFASIENMVNKIRTSSKNRLVTIAIDSIAGATTKTEQLESFEKEGYGTAKAYLLSKALRKVTNLISKQRIALVCTNQLREKIGAFGHGDKFITPGGKALPFHSSIRIRLKPEGQIKNASKETVGIKTKAVVVKNRFGPPFRSATFNIYFARGIDKYGSWLTTLEENGGFKTAKISKVDADGNKKTKAQIEIEKAALKKNKSCSFDYTDETLDSPATKVLETVTFEKANFDRLLEERPEIKEFLYVKLCKCLMFHYENELSEIDREDIEIDCEADGMDD